MTVAGNSVVRMVAVGALCERLGVAAFGAGDYRRVAMAHRSMRERVRAVVDAVITEPGYDAAQEQAAALMQVAREAIAGRGTPAARVGAFEALAAGIGGEAMMRRRHKYGARPVTVDGVRYASQAEAIRGQQLAAQLRLGLIRELELQPRFALGCPENVYVADFRVVDDRGRVRVEDVKGFETPAFRRNKRLWRKYGPHPLHVLTRQRRGDQWRVEIIEGEHTHGRDAQEV